ncbi:MAG TPA: tail fiber domain-containing protein [Dissulfurispiraceae bacterium]|nr:tail fiber domain-containing protein [Dissulfurispiraceae bacterium]
MNVDVSQGIVHEAGTYLAEAMGSAKAFLVPDAEAVDVVVESTLPTLFFDDTSDEDCLINHDWQITASGGINNNDANNVFTISGMGESATGTCSMAVPIITINHTGAGGVNSPANSLVIDANGDLRFAADGMFFDRSLSRLGIGMVSPQYKLSVSGESSNQSTLHFTNTGTDVGGWLTSVADNNFFVSSGAMWDSSAVPTPGWVQKSPDTRAVMAGSGGSGYRVMTRSGCAVGAVCPVITRMMIDYDGNAGFGIAPIHPLHMASGAHVTAGGIWMNASSRKYKEHIEELALEDALKTIRNLNPVTFSYKAEPSEKHVGFVAEDVPDLVATKDRQGLSPMDIVAVMTKVVQEQQKVIDELRSRIEKLESRR